MCNWGEDNMLYRCFCDGGSAVVEAKISHWRCPTSDHHHIANSSTMEEPKIHTYHCLCNQLILASTQSLPSTPRRAGESLDKAYIVTLPPLPKATNPESDAPPAAGQGDRSDQHYNVIHNLRLDRKPVVVRRSDGFETRYQYRCARCELVVGYQLDKAQFDAAEPAGRRQDVLYILPGALITTRDMADGKSRPEGNL
jgi:hypothetical protein